MSARGRHVPMRSCIACRNKTAKRDLLRIVSNSDGGAAFDAGGRLSGRGAYICPACARGAEDIRKGRLEHTLRTGIADDQWKEIITDLKAHIDTPTNRLTRRTQ